MRKGIVLNGNGNWGRSSAPFSETRFLYMIERAPSLAELTHSIKQQFCNHYGRSPRWIVAAPGRVNIIGEHTDYNGGFVFPMGIERYTLLAADFAQPSSTPQVCVHCMRFNETAHILLSPINRGEPRWSNYIRGVIQGYQEKGFTCPPLDVAMNSTVPLGGGLSSSAALEVATGTLIEAVSGKQLSLQDKALIGQSAEHHFAGVPCGIMDQFISAMARKDSIMLLDCRSYETRWTTVSDPSVAFLIINSNVKHQLASGEYAKRRNECEKAASILGVSLLRDADSSLLESAKTKMDDRVYRRAKHVISENERTLQASDALGKSRWEEAGRLMYESHRSLQNDFEVSCSELDCIVDIAHQIGLEGGVYGCRMTGGGFGGCAISLVKSERIPEISSRIQTEYEAKTGQECTLFASRPAEGALEIKTF